MLLAGRADHLMKAILATTALVALAAVSVASMGDSQEPAASAPVPARANEPAAAAVDWTGWVRPLAARDPGTSSPPAPAVASEADVVDAHWMALTMWGEARGQGEEGMRAVGHVIDNRRRLGRHGSFATETVTEAWQFSCWNANDPNRAAMLGVLDLPRGSRDYRLWLEARRLANEILAGRSTDPTGGALFYHTTAVAPRWSQGVTPVARIGTHLFFRAARRA
jgi:spore germination cell wall hydrolase CwlJ-like protein